MAGCGRANSTRGDQELLAMIEEAGTNYVLVLLWHLVQSKSLKLLRSRVLNPSRTTNQSLECQEIAAEAIKRGIVETISTRSVERFLKEADLKPHQSRYWLNANPSDPQALQSKWSVWVVCSSNWVTPTRNTSSQYWWKEFKPWNGWRRLSMQPTVVERLEFEYERHGTQCLIANLEVATGQVIAPSIGRTQKLTFFIFSRLLLTQQVFGSSWSIEYSSIGILGAVGHSCLWSESGFRG